MSIMHALMASLSIFSKLYEKSKVALHFMWIWFWNHNFVVFKLASQLLLEWYSACSNYYYAGCVSLKQGWIRKSERIRKRILHFFTKQINPRSLRSWCMKGTRELHLSLPLSFTMCMSIDIFVDMSNLFSRDIKNRPVEKLSNEDFAVTIENM